MLRNGAEKDNEEAKITVIDELLFIYIYLFSRNLMVKNMETMNVNLKKIRNPQIRYPTLHKFDCTSLIYGV